MTTDLEQRINDILVNAVIIDDCYDVLDIPAEVTPIEAETKSGKPPAKPKSKKKIKKKKDSVKDSPDLIEFGKWLGRFKAEGITPLPLFFNGALDENDELVEKDMIIEMISLSDFPIIDYQLKGGSITAIDIIKHCIPNKNMIWPIIVFSKVGGSATEAFDNNENYDRISSIAIVPTFRHIEHPGLFVQVYNKDEFDPGIAKQNLVDYIEKNFERYSISAMEFISMQKKNLRTIMEKPLGSNFDSALVTHAKKNEYKNGNFGFLLQNAFLEKSGSAPLIG